MDNKSMTNFGTPRLQIIRGMPGSGKTTLALKEYPDLLRIEADMFFTRGGRYHFNLDINTIAIEWFYDMVSKTVDAGLDFVLTGVFAGHTERLPRVIALAQAFDYDIFIKTLTSDYGNTHGVPDVHLDAMRKAFVPEDELKLIYQSQGVNFGLMPRTEKVESPNGNNKIQSQLPEAAQADVSTAVINPPDKD